MTIHPRDLVAYVGGAALERYGVLTRRIAPIARGGEEGKETFARAVVARAVDRDGWLREVESGLPQIDWSQIAGTPVLVMEGTRTNLLLRSRELDNASWAKNNVTISADAVQSPSGETTMDKLVETSATGQHRVHQDVTIAAGAYVAASCHVKQAERSKCEFLVTDVAGTNFFGVRVDLTDGSVITNTTGGSGALRLLPKVDGPRADGSYRIRFSGQIDGSSTTARVQARILDDAGASSYTGDAAKGIYYTDLQLEEADFPSSVIATAGTTAQRVGDQLTVPVSLPRTVDWSLYLRSFPLWGDVATLTAATWPDQFKLSDPADGGVQQIQCYRNVSSAQMVMDWRTPPADGQVAQTYTSAEAVHEIVARHRAADHALQLEVNGTASAYGSPPTSQGTVGGAWSKLELLTDMFVGLHACILTRGIHTQAEFQELLP